MTPDPSEPVRNAEKHCTTSFGGEDVAVTPSQDEKMRPKHFDGTTRLIAEGEVILIPTPSDDPRGMWELRLSRPERDEKLSLDMRVCFGSQIS